MLLNLVVDVRRGQVVGRAHRRELPLAAPSSARATRTPNILAQPNGRGLLG
jgi:hypothetical protein